MIWLSFTKNVLGAQLTLTQPFRLLPSNIGTKPASSVFLSSASAGAATANPNSSAAIKQERFMLIPRFGLDFPATIIGLRYETVERKIRLCSSVAIRFYRVKHGVRKP